MLFHLFCMFYNYWRIKYRTQNSAGKRTVKIPYLRISALPGKHQRVLISPEDGESQKESRRGPHGTHTWSRRGPTPGRAWTGCGAPGPPLVPPFSVLHPPKTLRHREPSRKYSAASAGRKTPDREKLSDRAPRGSSPCICEWYL